MDWTDLAQDRDNNELSGSIKGWEILKLLHSWPLLKKESTP
jgi:hypothetical protein